MIIRWDFPGGPVINTAFQWMGCGFEPWSWKLRSHMALSQKNQNIKQKQNVTNSIKTLEMVHIKKKNLKRYLFMAVSRLRGSRRDLCCVMWNLQLLPMDSFQSQYRGSRAHRLSCSEARGILVSPPGIGPTSPALQGRF